MMEQVVDLCSYVESQTFSKVTEIIRDHVEKAFGQSLDNDYHEAEVNEIRNWLLAFDCVKDATPLPGILKSNPPRKVVAIAFEIDGVVIEKNLKLSLGKKLEVLYMD